MHACMHLSGEAFFLNHFLLQLVLRRIFCLFDSLISVLGVTYDLETSYYFVRECVRVCERERSTFQWHQVCTLILSNRIMFCIDHAFRKKRESCYTINFLLSI